MFSNYVQSKGFDIYFDQRKFSHTKMCHLIMFILNFVRELNFVDSCKNRHVVYALGLLNTFNFL